MAAEVLIFNGIRSNPALSPIGRRLGLSLWAVLLVSSMLPLGAGAEPPAAKLPLAKKEDRPAIKEPSKVLSPAPKKDDAASAASKVSAVPLKDAVLKAGASKASPEKKTIKSESKPKRNYAAKRMLVPPPPPVIPLMNELGGESRHLSTAGIVLDYLSKGELEKLKSRLETVLAKAKTDKQERAAGIKEKSERSAQFEQLFKEGVVSRRELEAARRELDEVAKSGSDLDDRVADAQTDLDRVTKALDRLIAKQPKPAKDKVPNVRSAALKETSR